MLPQGMSAVWSLAERLMDMEGVEEDVKEQLHGAECCTIGEGDGVLVPVCEAPFDLATLLLWNSGGI